MVSSLFSKSTVFRGRKDKKVSTSSEEQAISVKLAEKSDDEKMVLVPPVVVTEAPTEAEIIIEAAEKQPYEPSSSADANGVHQVQVELEIEPKPDDLSQPIEQIRNILAEKIEENRQKLAQIVEFASKKVGDFWKELTNDVKSNSHLIMLIILGTLTIFTATSLYRVLTHSVEEEKSFFCRWFADPFHPMFDAICEDEPINLADKLTEEMLKLADEIGNGIASVFHTIGSGFAVFGTIFNAVFAGITNNISFGFHELGENVGENVSHLLHFIIQFFHAIIHFIFSTFATIAGYIAGFFNCLHDQLIKV